MNVKANNSTMALAPPDFASLPCWTKVGESFKERLNADKEFLKGIHREVWLNDTYEIASLQGHWDVLLDLGCNLGFVSQRLLLAGLVDEVEAVECYGPYLEASRQNLAYFGERVTYHLGFAVGKNYLARYAIPPTGVPLLDVDDLVKKHVGKKILLKIDIEGWEYPVMQSLTQNALNSRINRVMGEFHDITKDKEGEYFFWPSRDTARKILLDFAGKKQVRIPIQTAEGAILGTFFME